MADVKFYFQMFPETDICVCMHSQKSFNVLEVTLYADSLNEE